MHRYVMYATPECAKALAKEVDPFGDHYTIPTNKQQLKEVFAKVREKHAHPYLQFAEANGIPLSELTAAGRPALPPPPPPSAVNEKSADHLDLKRMSLCLVVPSRACSGC
jgi:hypothetical protein